MASHRIHLRGPWDYDWTQIAIEHCEPVTKSGTATMPQDWNTLFGKAAGTAQFRRKFHRPTNLEPHEQVMILFTEVRGAGSVQLNGRPVGQFTATGGPIEFDISTLMNSFNELTVDITFDPNTDQDAAGGLFGVAALEIRTE